MKFSFGIVQSVVEVEHFNLSTNNKVLGAEAALWEVLEQVSAGERQVAEQSRRS